MAEIMDSKVIGTIHYDHSRKKNYLMTRDGVRVVETAIAHAVKSGYTSLDSWYQQRLTQQRDRWLVVLAVMFVVNTGVALLLWKITK